MVISKRKPSYKAKHVIKRKQSSIFIHLLPLLSFNYPYLITKRSPTLSTYETVRKLKEKYK